MVSHELASIPLVFNWVEGGKTPPLEIDEIAQLGFAAVIMPISTILASAQAMVDVLSGIRDRGTPAGVVRGLPSFASFTDLIGLPAVSDTDARFSTS